MLSQTAKQKITIYIWLNISRGKGNQVMKFGQLKYNMKNHTQTVEEKLVLDPFLKNQN